MIKILDLKKSFGKEEVLNGLNLTIQDGEITVILGRSGAGKSVLLKHIIGLTKPDDGKIFVNGDEITSMTEKELNRIRVDFGMLFQEGALFDSLSVWENVAFPLVEREHLPKAEIRTRVAKKIDQVELTGMDDKMPSELSGGMKKRVGLARALVTDPKIVLFDEPTSGLDPITENSITDLILKTHEIEKITYVIISHNIKFALAVADKIAMLHKGKIYAEGTPAQFQKSRDPLISGYVSGNLNEIMHG
ncbi:MAG: ABC transporter ATP-binding protein [Deltaproteobacteria bacterium]|nr:ABC transporter ATP-binding protein [Candidatus Zymogenaceae bacterium]